jgi:two-component system cell cycle response regulator
MVESLLSTANSVNFKITTVSGVSAGIDVLRSENIEAVILYLSLDDENSFNEFQRLHDNARKIPFLVITEFNNEGTAIKIIKEGAEEVLLKENFSPETVTRSISFAIERNRLKETIRKTSDKLKRSLVDLKKVNKKIIESQKSVIEEERLKVILMMAGATAHEIKQPLTAILGNIELMKMFEKIPPELERYIAEIKGAGNRINEIVSSAQEVYDFEGGNPVMDITPIKFDRQVNVLSVEDS